MTGPAGEFREYIVANIDEDTPRLAYADWLDEHDQPARAEFVRVQIQRARLPHWDAAQVGLHLRERALLDAHGEAWLAELPKIEGARWEGFRRGVVAEVSFASFEAMRKHAHECRAVAPVEAITVRWPRRREGRTTLKPIAELRELTLTGMPDYEAFEWVAQSPQLSTLRSLTARGLWGDSLDRLLASPHLGRLKALRIPSNNLGSRGLRALSHAVALTGLEELDFSSQARHERYHDAIIRAEGVQALMNWPGIASVRVLNLRGNDLTRDGLRALVRSPHAAGLKELSLRDARLDGSALAELDGAVPGLRLEALDIGQNVLKDVGAEYVALVPCLCELKALALDRCEVRLSGAKLFANKAKFLDDLRVLDIGHNHFGAEGLSAVLAREPGALHTLRACDNDLLDDGAEALAASPLAGQLIEADLSQNKLTGTTVRAFKKGKRFGKLQVLRLADNSIREADVNALQESALGRRLAVLDFTAAPPAPPPAPFDEDNDDEPIPF